MSSAVLFSQAPGCRSNDDCYSWYGIRTRSNHEKVISALLDSRGYEQYLPLHRVRRHWSDRVVVSEQPLFPGYVFCRFDPNKRLGIITIPGVVTVIGFGRKLAPIADSEIEAVRTVLESGVPVQTCGFLQEGQRVRVKQGVLTGVEGVLLKRKSQWRLVISVTTLHRSIAVEIDQDSVVGSQ
jgi:transcription antitermination factor NusG